MSEALHEYPVLSLVIPIFKNEENLPRLLTELTKLDQALDGEMEVVFVIDGSPDRSEEVLRSALAQLTLRTQLVSLSRNFGSFSAIAAGLECGRGTYFACIAADLQEPPDLVLEFSRLLKSGAADIVFGARITRSDPWLSRIASGVFWWAYRRFVNKDIPPNGIDVFGCSGRVRDELMNLREVNTNLVALLLWLGYRRTFVPYQRQPRLEGRSAWTISKKLRYAFDSVFNFTDLPLRLLLGLGMTGITISAVMGTIVLLARLLRHVEVPGYTPIVLAICFFGGLTALGLGIIGQYLWLCLQNTRGRPNFVIASRQSFGLDSVKKGPEY
jgi:glycosyltransferase involved in cell wall biosynthesis